MSSIYNLITKKVELWIEGEMANSQSNINMILSHIKRQGKLREPQVEAIKTYLWLKFKGGNLPLYKIIENGLLFDDDCKNYENYNAIDETNYTLHFLNYFAQENNFSNLIECIQNDPSGKDIDYKAILKELLHNFNYTNYLFSLPMGAGKTYLIAIFIYLDLYFARILPEDKRFSHNFIVLAPLASKTAIMPSLQTIKNFDPNWILPKNKASELRQTIQIEILDALSSKRKDKLQGNNPNLEKVNRITKSKKFGLVFITNAEKVVMEYYDKDAKKYSNKDSFLYDLNVTKTNELREGLSLLPNFNIFLDEVHHTYGKKQDYKSGLKRLRVVVDTLNKHENLNSVIGLSGTPYIKESLIVKNKKITLNQIQDVVYNYPLNIGIGKFLKTPIVRKSELDFKVFIRQALEDFFNDKDFNREYKDGSKSKIAFYCPSIEVLNEEILPIVKEWYSENNKDESEIFKHYSNNKEYKLPKDNLAIFKNLDKPYSKKRAILLVAIGTEGWDCKSLTAVVLPRKTTTKNFVLQTTCRCLREVDDASKEKALIYLSPENYDTLDAELKENYRLSITDIETAPIQDSIQVQIRKNDLGKLKYKQVKTKYKIVKTKPIDINKSLKDFTFKVIEDTFNYDKNITEGSIGKEGIEREIYISSQSREIEKNYTSQDFIYDLAKYTYGLYSESELLKQYSKELNCIFKTIEKKLKWIENNPRLTLVDIIKIIASTFSETIEYKIEDIKEDIQIDLLSWNTDNPTMSARRSSGSIYNFLPEITKDNLNTYKRHPEDIIEDTNNLDTQDISFNFTPYKMDSSLEQNALLKMLKLNELKDLEVYFNGYKDEHLETFYIETNRGKYTPDFLIIKRNNNKEIDKILIIETKGSVFNDEDFKAKEKFIEESFLKHNSQFKYICFVDNGKNDFKKHLDKLLEKIKEL